MLLSLLIGIPAEDVCRVDVAGDLTSVFVHLALCCGSGVADGLGVIFAAVGADGDGGEGHGIYLSPTGHLLAL